jgi:hypothetical protein
MTDNSIKFKEGQVWTYKTRKGEEESYFTILKIEEYSKVGLVIHIAIDNVKIKASKDGEDYLYSISHSPFSIEALKGSVSNLKYNHVELPDYIEGYQEWKDAFDKGKAGVYAVTVAECVELIEQTINQ